MLRLSLFIGCLAVMGCGKDVTKDIEALADRACACTDAPCADKVVDELVALAEKHKNASGDQGRANEAAQRLGACAVKAGVDTTKFVAKMKKLAETK